MDKYILLFVSVLSPNVIFTIWGITFENNITKVKQFPYAEQKLKFNIINLPNLPNIFSEKIK